MGSELAVAYLRDAVHAMESRGSGPVGEKIRRSPAVVRVARGAMRLSNSCSSSVLSRRVARKALFPERMGHEVTYFIDRRGQWLHAGLAIHGQYGAIAAGPQ